MSVARTARSFVAARGVCIRAAALLAALLTTAPGLCPREFPPAAPPPQPFALPQPAVRTLPNGLKVLVIERRSLPLVTLRLVVKSGAEADPTERAGLAQLVASLLDQGTARRSAREIAEAIDFVGGTIQTGAEWDHSNASLTVLTDHARLAFDLLSDIVTRPTFPPEEVERRRRQTLSALEVLGQDPSYVADHAFHRLVFDGTPYGHPENGTTETVERISRSDLVDFHARHYSPANSILAVVGDLAPDDAVRLAEEFFGAWQAGQGSAPQVKAPLPAAARRVVIIDKPDAVQTEIRIGSLGIPRSSPDYFALTVANQVLGGPATNRLFKALRSQQGLTYSAASDLACHRSLGSWVAKTFTRTPATMPTVRLVLEQLDRLRDRSVRPSELATAQSYLVGNMALEFETSDSLSAHMLELMIHGLPLDFWQEYPKQIQGLEAEAVLAATRRFLDPDRTIVVMVGDARAFGSEAKKLGAIQVIPLGNLDLASSTLERVARSRTQD